MSATTVAEEKVPEPKVWRRLPMGYRIEDLQPNYYQEVMEMIEDCFVSEDILYINTEFSKDAASKKSFKERLLINMASGCSLAVFDERHTCEDIRPEAAHCLCEASKNGLGYQLMDTAVDVARHFNIPVIMGIFDCATLQKRAKQLNMETLFQTEYRTWANQASKLEFTNLGPDDHFCALMVGKVPPLPEPEPDLSEVKPKETKKGKGKKGKGKGKDKGKKKDKKGKKKK